ncbi:MAG: His/Gly/Thr/Pro-type tRNA ligase C-terminal domain-containing protein, partial [Nanoarchaeota archaeon]
RSYKDLPLRINQWANVVRWETDATKLFLRSREFLWQEGHCVYETEKECDKETLQYIKLYKKLCEELLALPVLVGKKTEKEKFAGAKYTLAIEAFMPDGKALQCGTSHNLGQGFAKSFGIEFIGKDEKKHLPWQNSWGLSTRLIGATVMMHSDNKGLVLPPKIAKNQIVIIPILFDKTKSKILKQAEKIKRELDKFNPILDDREDYSPGWKFSEWELKGIPLRIEIGPKDLEKESITIVKRNTGEKSQLKIKEIKTKIPEILEEIQNELFSAAKKFLESNIIEVKNWNELIKTINEKKMAKTIWCGNGKCEEEIKDKTGGATSRCMPLDSEKISGNCPNCRKPAKTKIYFSKSY